MIMRTRQATIRSRFRAAARTVALSWIALSAAACGRGLFSSSSSSSSGAAAGTSAARSVYVTNFGDGEVSALHRNGAGGLNSPATIASGSINGPAGLVATTSHTLYVANAADKTIHEFTISSNGNLTALTTIAAGTNPLQPVLTPTGFAYAINSGGSISEYQVDSTNGELAANKTASTTSGLVQPVSGAATKSFLYVTDQQSGAGVVLTFRINADGTLAAGPASTPSLGSPGGPAVPNQILVDPTGKWVFVNDGAAGLVSLLKVSGSGLTFIGSVPTSAPGTAEAGLLYLKKSSNIFIYCADQAANSVSVFLFNAGTQSLTLTSASPTGSSLNAPIGLAADKKGANLYVANSGNGTITQFTINTADGSLSNPVSIATENPANAASAPDFILVTN